MFVCGNWECYDICCRAQPPCIIMTRPLGRTIGARSNYLIPINQHVPPTQALWIRWFNQSRKRTLCFCDLFISRQVTVFFTTVPDKLLLWINRYQESTELPHNQENVVQRVKSIRATKHSNWHSFCCKNIWVVHVRLGWVVFSRPPEQCFRKCCVRCNGFIEWWKFGAKWI